MGGLQGRRVVLGVSGGIAAYKAVDVCRRLVDAGAHVMPVMTEGATHFVGPATFSALASEPVRTSLWEAPEPIPHTRLGQTADLVLVRFVGNRWSGKQGHALAAEAAARGAHVVLVTTTDRAVPDDVEAVRVETAADMEDAVLARAPAADVVLMAAAVADFRPKAA